MDKTWAENTFEEMRVMREFLEDHGKPGVDIDGMYEAIDIILGYAERCATLVAESLEAVAIAKAETYDSLINDPRYSSKGREYKIAATVAPLEKLSLQCAALQRRLHDTRWVLMQAVSVRKTELEKLH